MSDEEIQRLDLKLSPADYQELKGWADKWYPDLAKQMEETKLIQHEHDENTIVVLKAIEIDEQKADLFFESLMDSEIYGYDGDESKYFCGLVELWRPIVEGAP